MSGIIHPFGEGTTSLSDPMIEQNVGVIVGGKEAEPTLEDLKRRIDYMERDRKSDQEHITRMSKRLRNLRNAQVPTQMLAQAEGVLSTLDPANMPPESKRITQVLHLLVAYLHAAQDYDSYDSYDD